DPVSGDFSCISGVRPGVAGEIAAGLARWYAFSASISATSPSLRSRVAAASPVRDLLHGLLPILFAEDLNGELSRIAPLVQGTKHLHGRDHPKCREEAVGIAQLFSRAIFAVVDVDDPHLSPHALTAPAVRPWMNCRCIKMYTTTTGIVTIASAAKRGPQLTEYS